MDLDVVAPIYPGHCPLHLASSLQRPGKGKFPSPDPQGRFGSSLQHGQFLWVLLLHKACCFAHSGSSSTCWKAWLGRVDPLRQAESCWLLWMHVSLSLHSRREHQGGDGSIIIITCCPWFHPSAGCTRQGRSPDSMAASAVASSWWLGITV